MDDDPVSNDSPNPHFEQLLTALAPHAQIRRRLLQLGLGSVVLPFLGLPALAAADRSEIGFRAIAASTEDLVRVPESYILQVLYAWGDPISNGPAFRSDAGNSAAEQAEQTGMHHDGMHFFPFVSHGKPSSTHGLLCVNHEYTDENLLHPDGRAGWSEAIVLPFGEGLSIVATPGGHVIRCDCGHDFCAWDGNWKRHALIRVRDTEEALREVYPAMAHCDPDWQELREYHCPSCARQLEVEAVAPGYPVVHEFLPDLEGFYRDWLGRELPTPNVPG